MQKGRLLGFQIKARRHIITGVSDDLPAPDDAVQENERGLSVLVVEDDPSHQLLIRRALTRPGSRFTVVQLAETSQEALDYAGQMTFDCMLVDNRIPGHRGLDLVDHLRERGVDAPFVLMTSAGSEDLAVQAYRKQVADYVVKAPNFWNELPKILLRVVEIDSGRKAAASLTERLRRTTDKLQTLNGDLLLQNQELTTVKAALAAKEEEVVALKAEVERLSAKG